MNGVVFHKASHYIQFYNFVELWLCAFSFKFWAFHNGMEEYNKIAG